MAPTERYTKVAVALHWAIAAFILANLSLGIVMEGFKPDTARIAAVRLHESFGLSVFVLTLVRIAWRLTHKPPPFDPHTPAWEKLAAHVTHGFLYFLMLAMPIMGWLIISSNWRRPMIIYWTLELPPFGPVQQLMPGPDKTALHDTFVQLHVAGALILFLLLLLHVAAALKHQFWEKQPEFRRMWIGKN